MLGSETLGAQEGTASIRVAVTPRPPRSTSNARTYPRSGRVWLRFVANPRSCDGAYSRQAPSPIPVVRFWQIAPMPFTAYMFMENTREIACTMPCIPFGLASIVFVGLVQIYVVAKVTLRDVIAARPLHSSGWRYRPRPHLQHDVFCQLGSSWLSP